MSRPYACSFVISLAIASPSQSFTSFDRLLYTITFEELGSCRSGCGLTASRPVFEPYLGVESWRRGNSKLNLYDSATYVADRRCYVPTVAMLAWASISLAPRARGLGDCLFTRGQSDSCHPTRFQSGLTTA